MAQQASDAKSNYLTHIAHGIRASMSSLMMLAKGAKKQSSNQDALNADLDKISDTVNYMTVIVADISEASISERLAGEQAMESFALCDVLDNASTMMEPNIQEAQVTLEMSLDEKFDPRHVGNKTKLQQILINFLTSKPLLNQSSGRWFRLRFHGERNWVEPTAATAYLHHGLYAVTAAVFTGRKFGTLQTLSAK